MNDMSIRQLDKSMPLKIMFLISQPKHMFCVLTRTFSIRRFILPTPKIVNPDLYENIHNFTVKFLFIWTNVNNSNFTKIDRQIIGVI